MAVENIDSKRKKINFNSINEGKITIIPPAKIAEANERIRKIMKEERKRWQR